MRLLVCACIVPYQFVLNKKKLLCESFQEYKTYKETFVKKFQLTKLPPYLFIVIKVIVCRLFLMLLFDYADIQVVQGDKNNITLMNNVQVLQNKAAKIILDKPLYSSASEALATLNWITLEQRRFYHRCLYVFKCINGYTNHSMELLTHGDVHNYNTRNKDKPIPPHVIRNWGKQRMAYHAIIDWNTLNKDIRSSLNIVIFKHFYNILSFIILKL